MDYNKFTKEQLISFIEKIQQEKGLTYEDQMKLMILNNSPFTIWASDRDCKITFWTENAENLYGFSRDEATGKDFVDLFVAEDEKRQAREDQIDIIDNGTTFHNLAKDKAKRGNDLELLTVCRRIEDPITRHMWNAEIGIPLNYYSEELDRLYKIRKESREIDKRVVLFSEDAQGRWRNIQTRYGNICESLTACEMASIRAGRRDEFKGRKVQITEQLEGIITKASFLRDEYNEHARNTNTLGNLDSVCSEFTNEYNRISIMMGNIALDVYALEMEYNSENSLIPERDSLLSYEDSEFRNLLSSLSTEKRKVEEEIAEYRKQITDNPSQDSEYFHRLTAPLKLLDKIKNEIEDKMENMRRRISNIRTINELNDVKQELYLTINQLSESIEGISNDNRIKDRESVYE